LPLRLVPKETDQLPRADAPMASQAFGRVSVQPGPKKETARIGILSRASAPPAIVQTAGALVATSVSVDPFDSFPRWFCWGLLGLSALIFLIQIWNYALS
jgi:hypothetical protein